MDAAVLCTIPLAEDAWNEREQDPLIGDFERFISETRYYDEPAWPYFRSEAAVIAANLKKIEKLGARVILNATTSDLRLAASTHKNVILIGHQKGMLLRRDSVRNREDFVAGRRIELWDAMLDEEALCDLYPESFCGATLWIVCHSSIPGERFRRRYPEAMIFSIPPEALLGAGTVRLYATLKLMRMRGVRFWEAIVTAGEIFDQVSWEYRP